MQLIGASWFISFGILKGTWSHGSIQTGLSWCLVTLAQTDHPTSPDTSRLQLPSTFQPQRHPMEFLRSARVAVLEHGKNDDISNFSSAQCLDEIWTINKIMVGSQCKISISVNISFEAFIFKAFNQGLWIHTITLCPASRTRLSALPGSPCVWIPDAFTADLDRRDIWNSSWDSFL